MPPGWDERYITVFGSTFDEVGVEGLTSMTTKLRSAGLAVETLPGPAAAAARALAARALPARARARQGGRDRRARRAHRARPRDARAAVRHDPPPGQPEARAHAADDLPVGVHRPRRAHLAPDRQQRLEHRRAGRGAQPPTCACASPTRTGWTSSASAWTRCARRHRPAAPARQPARAARGWARSSRAADTGGSQPGAGLARGGDAPGARAGEAEAAVRREPLRPPARPGGSCRRRTPARAAAAVGRRTRRRLSGARWPSARSGPNSRLALAGAVSAVERPAPARRPMPGVARRPLRGRGASLCRAPRVSARVARTRARNAMRRLRLDACAGETGLQRDAAGSDAEREQAADRELRRQAARRRTASRRRPHQPHADRAAAPAAPEVEHGATDARLRPLHRRPPP